MNVSTMNQGQKNLSLITEDFRCNRLYSPSSKKLHPQQGKHHNEEKEEKKQADNGLHGAHEGHNQVPERRPVSDRNKSQTIKSNWSLWSTKK